METSRLYELELWDTNDVPVADISSLAKNRRYSIKRNEAETLTFDIDLDALNRLAASIGAQSRTILWPYQTEVKVKRDGRYLFGSYVVEAIPTFDKRSATLQVKCVGYLNLFGDRYTNNVYNATEATEIACDLITSTQAQANGDFGVTIGAQQYVTGYDRDRTDWRFKRIKDAIQELTRLENGRFDFKFTWDKQFETYQQLGSVRQDVVLRYGEGSNILTVTVPTEAQSLYNKVYGLGYGFGDDQITSTQSDVTSQLNYKLREGIVQYNSNQTQEVLDENTSGYLLSVKDMLQIPQVTTNRFGIDLGQTSIGDRIQVDLSAYDYTSNIDGLYRIEQIDVGLDDNDDETITLAFDDFGVDQDEL